MFDFRPISISDKERVNEALARSNFRACEYCFANNLAWRRLADTIVTFHGKFYISCSFYDEKPVFTFPSGGETTESTLPIITELKKYANDNGQIFRMASVNPQQLTVLKEIYSDKLTAQPMRDSFDYIYLSEDLREMKGKRFHGKRGHIADFKKHDWEFRTLTAEDFETCALFAAKGYNGDNFSAAVEQYAIHTFFTYYNELELCGGVLYHEGEFVGFTIGERLNSDTFGVHIEKARADIRGAYPVLCSEFAKAETHGYKYINREEDLGIEGLRRSKLSYHPVFLQEKYMVTIKD